MDHYGLWGIIPPLLTIILAFVTKDVIVSLFLGIFSGALIIAGGNPGSALMNLSDLLAGSLADGWNIRIFLFCALLGGLVGMLSKTGATRSFGRWASAKLKTGTSSQFMTFVFGIIIFIDDYFNSMSVGTVMRPISDKTGVSRAKLAYILDSTAAPVCILAPISSWVVTVMSIVRDAQGFEALGMTEFEFFIRSIPYNLYALLALLMVLSVIFLKRDFGPMLQSETLAKQGVLYNEEKYGPASGSVEEENDTRAKPFDMLFPIIVLIASAVAFFPIVTWIGAIDGETVTSFSQAVSSMSLGAAFNDTDSSVALMYAVIFTVTATYVYYLVRRLLTLKESGEALRDGIKSMIPALIILTMAWSIGSIIKSPRADGGLGLGLYLSEVVKNGGFPVQLLPCILFILSAVIAFATGTSWGTFGIMIPIAMPIVTGLAQSNGFATGALVNASMISIAAVIGGAVFGDHASPISDTTILSSTGASCPHLEHVATQMPYAIFVAVCSFIGFVIGGLLLNAFAAWIAALAVFALGLAVLPKLCKGRA
ncbi:Na+/H+ antiporter NhaC family protein [Treponema brennaborense]|uniref:Na+/H+ antiporter NhaC n=1 Tax=Treponema brennaborense (strain DSM 12168 / CIP 105900 / DD5/3) TaxID=906968 RepID=F4LL32_TREBD|nr:Na+/H+ antiporter NhaC family protein [Treponema brennaborense]AEE17606.1 Na+/H+ antiporter NhaC [Treponema brennaborense DSM 12168]